jgi:hypothetical protein
MDASAEEFRSFMLAGKTYERGYYLVDGIYPPYPMLIGTVANPVLPETKHFAKCQESARKDVERAFGRLQAKWHIISQPCRLWFDENMHHIMKACLILHNMTIEDGDLAVEREFAEIAAIPEAAGPLPEKQAMTADQLAQFLIHSQNLKVHEQLHRDLIAHQWSLRQQEE